MAGQKAYNVADWAGGDGCEGTAVAVNGGGAGVCADRWAAAGADSDGGGAWLLRALGGCCAQEEGGQEGELDEGCHCCD
jgi:hypothetical protein